MLLQKLDTRNSACREVGPLTAQPHKAEFGQFMTPSSVARFMVSLFPPSTQKTCRLLDAGAGVGALSCAFLDGWVKGDFAFEEVEATAYEIDGKLCGHLEQNLAGYSRVTAHIIAGDYIDLATSEGLQDRGYTHAILNPPYKKINGRSGHRLALRSVGIETVNLYSAFVALAVSEVGPGGQIVAIIPRSFCNGPYYRPFRDFILERAAIRHMHLFESRNKVFRDDRVLQESIIIRLECGGKPGPVTVTTSTDDSFSDLTTNEHPFNRIVFPDDSERFIHVPTTTEKSAIERLPAVRYSLADIGVKVSTGPVVGFRLKAHLRDMPEPGAVPLIYPAHLSVSGTVWPMPGLKKPNAIMRNHETEKWLYPNGFYCVVRRFSSKEEKRRVVARLVEPAAFGDHSMLGFENHMNLFHENKRGLPEALARGLVVFLSATAVDECFRRFNGHTQVNATDLKRIKYPSRDTLIQLGEWAIQKGTLTQQEIDAKVVSLTEIKDAYQSRSADRMNSQNNYIEAAQKIIVSLGLPRAQQNERSALCLLALLNLTPGKVWADAENPLMGITPIMDWARDHYDKEYAPNTRETFRRQTMHQFCDAGVALYNPDKPDRPVNSPKAVYQIEPAALTLLRTFGTSQWHEGLAAYLAERETLIARYAMEREQNRIPVEIAPGQQITLSPGEHSELIRAIIEDFGPRFAPGSVLVYAGDTGDKWGYFDAALLAELGVDVDSHGKMPDVVLHYTAKDWLLLVESVTSHGPVNGKRHAELAKLFSGSTAGLVYVTAFPNRAIMGRYLGEIAWETEVWVADAPSHLIHFNGERFLGPYSTEG